LVKRGEDRSIGSLFGEPSSNGASSSEAECLSRLSAVLLPELPELPVDPIMELRLSCDERFSFIAAERR
jgi:hypothetical protein